MTVEALDIRNRIVEFKEMRLGDINHNPSNWKIHTEDGKNALKAILKEIGFAGVPIVYHSKRTGGLTYADGHRRKETIPDHTTYVAITDMTDEEVDLFLATFDPLAQESETDAGKLGALFQRIKTDKPDLQSFLARLGDRNGLHNAEPEAPEDFSEYDEDIDTLYCCPKCGYEWSGNPN